MELEITVNGSIQKLDVAPNARLLTVLRDRLGLRGTKEGCGKGECGACTVLMEGRPVMSCITLAARAESVETIEGLAAEMRHLREAFALRGGFQCGFCTPGQIVRASVLVRHGQQLPEQEIRRAMSGNICRCTGYGGIVSAIRHVLSDNAAETARREAD